MRPNKSNKTQWHPKFSPVDFSGATAFLAAAKVPDLEMMKVLVAGGVDPNIPTFDGTTALMLVAGIGRVEGGVTRLVPDEILIPAAEYVIGLGNDINAVNPHGMTAVHGAAANGSDGVIRLLADKGAILDVKDRDGHTPIDLAEGLWSNFSILVHKSSADLLRKFTNR